MDKKKGYSNKITIGTDPEFVLVDNHGQQLNASSFKMFDSREAEIGSDGCGTPVEIRPPPTLLTEIEKFTTNIHDIFATIARYCHFQKYKILGGCGYGGRSPIGGHIHFGSNDFLDYKNREAYKNKDKIRWLLDTYFIPIINSFISPDDIAERIGSNFGRLGAIRNQPHGFEYRTPYSFLLSPFLTKAFFSLVALIVYNYKKLKFDISKHQLMVEYYAHVYDSKTLFPKIYRKIKPVILKMMRYNSPNPKLNPYILSLFSLIEQKKRCKSFSVLDNYSLFPPPPQKFKMFFSHSSIMSNLRYILRNHIRNKNNGNLYIYGVDEHSNIPDTRDHTIFLSDNLPKITLSGYVKVSRYPILNFKGFDHKIGLSIKLRRALDSKRISSKFLIDYINNLKLKEIKNHV